MYHGTECLPGFDAYIGIDNKITSILIIKSEYSAITLTINAVTWWYKMVIPWY